MSNYIDDHAKFLNLLAAGEQAWLAMAQHVLIKGDIEGCDELTSTASKMRAQFDNIARDLGATESQVAEALCHGRRLAKICDEHFSAMAESN